MRDLNTVEHYFDWAATSPADEDILTEAKEIESRHLDNTVKNDTLNKIDNILYKKVESRLIGH